MEASRLLEEGKFLPLKRMRKKELMEECEMWRRIWDWVDPPVKYYLARVGALVGVVRRDYHRFLGRLLSTKWDLKELEIGTYEKVYDRTEGQYYFERKIVRLPANQVIDLEFIAERILELKEEASSSETSE